MKRRNYNLMNWGIAGLIFYILILVLAFIGEVKCIIHLCQCDFQAPVKAEVLYGIGTFTGAGAILGWFNFGK